MKYLAPDYYPHFHCKIGQCRTDCCTGWPVSFSISEYYRLLSVDCSPEIRRKLDIALHLTEHPTEDDYAMLLHSYNGNCPLRLSDGRCGLQTDAGENALPVVCRLYPRGIHKGECSCANSCEAVVELLARAEPIRFVVLDLETAYPERTRIHFFETADREMEIRLWLIHFIQDRRFSLGHRLAMMGTALKDMDEALSVKDHMRVEKLLNEPWLSTPPPLKGDALPIVRRLLELLKSDSMQDYAEMALDNFSSEKYIGRNAADEILRQAEPNWEPWFENLLVNHMFFSQFPFQDRPVSLKDETEALYAVYAMLRFLTIGAGNGDKEKTTDTIAALFRMVDHTAFDRYAVPVLHKIGADPRALLTI
ncbi:MAG: flagellin lysine-N-methylase [Clostridiales bacterium]|nr:flagellin lysine-N-methylase [Clostridiales bacterium]